MTAFDGPVRPPIYFRNKSRVSLLSFYKSVFEHTQVDQSLSKVPIEYIELKNLKVNKYFEVPITESFFSMPLYQILNDEMINFDSHELPRDDLDFLCHRYSDESYLDTPDLTASERKEL